METYKKCTHCGYSGIISINTEKNSLTGKYEIIIAQSQGIAIGDAIVVDQKFEKSTSRFSLREWWHNILRNHGKFSCYAIFTVLPSDKEALSYLTDFGKEIDLISGDDCLIIALGGTNFRRAGFDEKLWNVAVKQHSDEGYSVKIAKLFDIKLSEFPALMLFKDIRSPEHVIINLKDMTSSQIANYMRVIFSTISEAVRKGQDPLKAVSQYKTKEKIQATSKGAISELRSYAGITFEKAIEAWLATILK